MTDPKTIMDAVDRHVKASLEKFAGAKRDTAATRKAVEQLVSAPTPVVEVSIEDRRVVVTEPPPGVLNVAPIPAMPPIPDASPPKQKRRTIFGG